MRAPRLINCTEDDLKNVLRYVFALIGIRAQNLPAAEEKAFLHAYIFEHYGNHSPQEIRLAFDMAVQGRLDLDPSQVVCYENFSPLYFATIMRAYRAWASQEARKIETPEPEPLTEEEKKKIDAEYLDFLINQVFANQAEVDKLPSTIKNLRKWQKAN